MIEIDRKFFKTIKVLERLPEGHKSIAKIFGYEYSDGSAYKGCTHYMVLDDQIELKSKRLVVLYRRRVTEPPFSAGCVEDFIVDNKNTSWIRYTSGHFQASRFSENFPLLAIGDEVLFVQRRKRSKRYKFELTMWEDI